MILLLLLPLPHSVGFDRGLDCVRLVTIITSTSTLGCDRVNLGDHYYYHLPQLLGLGKGLNCVDTTTPSKTTLVVHWLCKTTNIWILHYYFH